MAGFTLTNLAKADLKEIGRYTRERWGREQRNTYLARLDACFRQLAANPLTGKECDDIREGYRNLIFQDLPPRPCAAHVPIGQVLWPADNPASCLSCSLPRSIRARTLPKSAQAMSDWVSHT